jgi:hypothetical protein
MARPLPPLWLSAPSRVSGLPRRMAGWIAAALAALLLASLTPVFAPAPPHGETSRIGQVTDLQLYEGVIAGLRGGGDYYDLAADALRSGSYPLRPFVTMRLPTHSVVQAAIPPIAAVILLDLLAIAVAAAWWVRLRPALPRRPARTAAMLLLAAGLVAFVQPGLVGFHEIWAAQLVALSLALRTPERWAAPAALALLAMLVRETAALYMLVMLGMALLEGRRREALGWGAALLGFAVALGAHAYGVAQVTGPLDPASPGWSGLLGFGFFAQSVAAATALQVLPLLLAGPLVALALFGWACWRDPLALRALATFSGYALAIAVFARADTFYWALMVAPLFLAGLAFAPDGLRDLGHSLLDRRRVRVQRSSQ